MYLDFSQEGFSWVWYGWTFDFLYYVNPKKLKINQSCKKITQNRRNSNNIICHRNLCLCSRTGWFCECLRAGLPATPPHRLSLQEQQTYYLKNTGQIRSQWLRNMRKLGHTAKSMRHRQVCFCSRYSEFK